MTDELLTIPVSGHDKRYYLQQFRRVGIDSAPTGYKEDGAGSLHCLQVLELFDRLNSDPHLLKMVRLAAAEVLRELQVTEMKQQEDCMLRQGKLQRLADKYRLDGLTEAT